MMEENLKAINLELKMLFEDLRALRVVRRASIKAGTKILRSHMFVVEKYLVDGRFDKMKARLVADGRDQESSLYPDKASPTVAIHSVFAVLGVMASKKGGICPNTHGRRIGVYASGSEDIGVCGRIVSDAEEVRRRRWLFIYSTDQDHVWLHTGELVVV
jgi:hypothetical protein